MRANLGKVDEMGNFEPLPIDWYHCSVVKAEEIKSGHPDYKEGKAPYVKTHFLVRSGDHAGRRIFKNFIFTENALGFMKSYLVAIGYPDSDQEVDIQPEEWLNEQCMVHIKHKSFNGKTQEEPDFYAPLSEHEVEPLEKVDIDALNAKKDGTDFPYGDNQ